jgi:hypothetical protein
MANGTTTVGEEEFKPPLPERVGEESADRLQASRGTGLHGGSQKTRTDVHWRGAVVFRRRGIMAEPIARAAAK